MTTEKLTWVLGAGGLLGSSVARYASRRGDRLWSPSRPIVWGRADTVAELRLATEAFLHEASGGPWQVVWCAGASVTGSTPEALSAESHSFDALLTALGTAAAPEAGALFVASSAGGVFAGSSGSPRDEVTTPRPLSPYGRSKLELEARATRMSREVGVPVLIGRISNLYGPGQNLSKPQGLISHIARAHLLARPISIYVPFDTMRDYLYVSDAARLVVSGLDRLRDEAATGTAPPVVVKVLASHQCVTVGYLVSEFRRITRRRPLVTYGASSTAAFQARDLRLRSVVWTELDKEPIVTLPVGIHRVIGALTASLGAGLLA